jgi:beta-glucanase (GH16 family)
MAFSNRRPTCNNAALAAKFGALAFEDEFNGTDINRTVWDAGFYNPDFGVKNYDCRSYNDAGTSRSVLRIWPAQDFSQDPNGELTPNNFFRRDITTGNRGFRQTYGFFEAMIKLPPQGGDGVWPAWWLFAPDGSANELDIIEAYFGSGAAAGGWGTSNYAATAWGNSANGFLIGTQKLSDALGANSTLTTQFHRYGCAWTPDTIYFLFDGTIIAQYANNGVNHEMMLYLDIWYGSAAGRPSAGATPTGPNNAMEVEYVATWLYTGAGGASGPAAADGAGPGTVVNPPPPPPPTTDPTLTTPAAYQPVGSLPTLGALTFDEKFDNAALPTVDAAKWNAHGMGGVPDNTFNYEVSNGALMIWPTAEFHARIIETKGKFYQKYGYFEAEIAACSGKGTWPGFFMMNDEINTPVGGQDSARPEFDIANWFPGGGSTTTNPPPINPGPMYHVGMHAHRVFNGGGSTPPSFSVGVFRHWDVDFIDDREIWASNDTINFTTVDAVYAGWAGKGAKIIKTFGSVPTWAARVPNVSDVNNFNLPGSSRYGTPGSMSGPANLDLYESYVFRFIQHTRQWLWAVEGWNEPFGDWTPGTPPYEFFTGDDTQLADIQQRVYRAAKRVDPNLLVFSPPQAWEGGIHVMLDAVCSDGTPMHHYFDVLSFHPYTYSGNGELGTQVIGDLVNMIHGLFDARGIARKPLADTEHGWLSVHPGGDAFASASQATKASIMLGTMQASKDLGLLCNCWYAYDDGMTVNNPNGSVDTSAGSAVANMFANAYSTIETVGNYNQTVNPAPPPATGPGVVPWQDGSFHPVDYGFSAHKANADNSFHVAALDARLSSFLQLNGQTLNAPARRYGVLWTKDFIQFYFDRQPVGPQLANDYWNWPMWIGLALRFDSPISGTPDAATPLGKTNPFMIHRISAWALADGTTTLTTALPLPDQTGGTDQPPPPPPVVQGPVTYQAGDQFTVRYELDKQSNTGKITYLQNGKVLRTVANLDPLLTFYFDSSIYTPGAQLRNIRFGKVGTIDWSSLGGAGLPADGATVGATIGQDLQGQMSSNPSDPAYVGNYIPVAGITDLFIGDVIQSKTFTPGSALQKGTGWRIDKNGNCVFESAVFRGILEGEIVKASNIKPGTATNFAFVQLQVANGLTRQVPFTMDYDGVAMVVVQYLWTTILDAQADGNDVTLGINIDGLLSTATNERVIDVPVAESMLVTGASLTAGSHTIIINGNHSDAPGGGQHLVNIQIFRGYR